LGCIITQLKNQLVISEDCGVFINTMWSLKVTRKTQKYETEMETWKNEYYRAREIVGKRSTPSTNIKRLFSD
jgi:hypothetical protein